MTFHMPSFLNKKAEFFILTTVVIVAVFYTLTKYINPYAFIDTSTASEGGEIFFFDNVKDKAIKTLQISNPDNFFDNLNTYKNFVDSLASEKGYNMVFTYKNTTRKVDFYMLLTSQKYTLKANFTAPVPPTLMTKSTIFYPTLDGWITYVKETLFNLDDSSPVFQVGEYYTPGAYEWHRAFIRFNISDIPNDATIQSATLHIRYKGITGSSPSEDPSQVMLAEVNDIGDSLGSGDWGNTVKKDYGVFIPSSSSTGWYSKDVKDSISTTNDFFSFRLNSDIEDTDDRYWIRTFDSSESSSKPYLNVTYTIYGYV